MFDVFEHMFDVIVNEVKKYAADARKLEAKADKQFERLDVIAVAQVKTKRWTVKHGCEFNVQRRIHVKLKLKQRTFQTEHVELCRELLSCSQILPSLG